MGQFTFIIFSKLLKKDLTFCYEDRNACIKISKAYFRTYDCYLSFWLHLASYIHSICMAGLANVSVSEYMGVSFYSVTPVFTVNLSTNF